MATTLAPQGPARVDGKASAVPAPRARFPAVDTRMVLAASGFLMLGFVVLHAGGNLLAFAGRDGFNAYARSLRELGAPVVGVGVLLTLGRAVLAGALVAHLVAHVRIMRAGTSAETACPSAAASRPAGRCPIAAAYAPTPPPYAAYPLPILRASGGAILLFVAFHLAQLTFGLIQPTFDPADPYHNLVTALRSWPVALAYVAVAAAVGAHLLPGVWTGVRSLRLIRPGTERLARALAPTIALVIFLSLAIVPVAVVVGIVR